MKNLLSIAAVTALLSTGAMADTITITGEVLPSAVVGFADVSGETLTGTDKFVDATIDLGIHEVDVFNSNSLTASSKSIFVKTNVATGNNVTMAITADSNGGLKDSVSGKVIPAVYKVGATTLLVDGSNTVTLASAANTGSTAIGDKFSVTTTADPDQLAGTYETVLTVAIVAN